MPHVQLEQTVFDFAIREINALEYRIIVAEDDADAMLWEQARQVVQQLAQGVTQRTLAEQWKNPRNNSEPYGKTHVFVTAQVFGRFNDQHPRPRFREVYSEIANEGRAHVSHNSGNNEWYTPKDYAAAVRVVLGEIDLDPASTAQANDVIKAKAYYTVEQNGLAQPWRGRVFLNPPYAQPAIEHFATKFAISVQAKDVTAGVVLVNNATETDWFGMLSSVATAICFPEGRVRFWSPDRATATPLQGQAVIYAGPDAVAFLRAFGAFGVVLVKP
jgi:phage N-6-adenine-methyltransferase